MTTTGSHEPGTPAQESAFFDVGERPSAGAYLRDIWQRRTFAARMPLEELRTEHLDTALGNLWHLLNPILATATYYLIFGVVLSVDRGQENFITFLTIGVFAYGYTQRCVTMASKSITKNRGLILSIYFPRAILPLTAVLSQTVALGPALVVMGAVALLTGETPSLVWLLIPPIFAGQALFNLGAALIIARLSARYRDVENLLTFGFRLLFYASGVLFPVARWVTDDSPWRLLFDWNPMYAFITLLRWTILDTHVSATLVLSTAVWTVVLLVTGFWYFLRGEQEYGRE